LSGVPVGVVKEMSQDGEGEMIMEKTIILLIALVATLLVLLVNGLKKHDYVTVYRLKNNLTSEDITGTFLSTGRRYTLEDFKWMSEEITGGDTNKTCLILNVIKLDD